MVQTFGMADTPWRRVDRTKSNRFNPIGTHEPPCKTQPLRARKNITLLISFSPLFLPLLRRCAGLHAVNEGENKKNNNTRREFHRQRRKERESRPISAFGRRNSGKSVTYIRSKRTARLPAKSARRSNRKWPELPERGGEDREKERSNRKKKHRGKTNRIRAKRGFSLYTEI